MPLNNRDVGHVINLLAGAHHRATYGVIGAAIATRVGNPAAYPGNYAMATVTMLNAFFGGRCAAASWAVAAANGFPTGYGNPPGPDYDPAWNVNTPLHAAVPTFLNWLDANFPGWDANLASIP